MESYSILMSSMDEVGGDDNNDSDDQLSEFLMDDLHCNRASTAPAKPLSDLGRFKREKEFTVLEQFVITANQMIHKSYEKYDLDSDEGQKIFKRYLMHIESLCEVRTQSYLSTIKSRPAPATTDRLSPIPTRFCIRKVPCVTSLRFGIVHRRPSRTSGSTDKSLPSRRRCCRREPGWLANISSSSIFLKMPTRRFVRRRMRRSSR